MSKDRSRISDFGADSAPLAEAVAEPAPPPKKTPGLAELLDQAGAPDGLRALLDQSGIDWRKAIDAGAIDQDKLREWVKLLTGTVFKPAAGPAAGQAVAGGGGRLGARAAAGRYHTSPMIGAVGRGRRPGGGGGG